MTQKEKNCERKRKIKLGWKDTKMLKKEKKSIT